MADAKISALASHGTPVAADYVASVLDSGPTSKKLLLSDLQNFVLQAFGGGSEISVTTTTTATIGRMHHCTGTTSDYTVTLPPASGNTGKLIGFRMGSASGLTKLVTIDGDGTETIDGQTTRIMWATETAILMCDGSNWHKISGKSVPMQVMLQRSTVTGDQSISASTWTPCATTELIFGTTLMEDAANDRITIVRPGKYLCAASFYMAGTTITTAYGTIGKNQASNSQVLANIAGDSTTAYGSVSTTYSCAVGDYIVASTYIAATSPRYESDAPTTIFAGELPQW